MTSPRCRCRRFRSAASRPDRLVVPAAGRQPHDSMVAICRPAAGTTKCHAIRESLWWVPTLVGTVPAASRSDRWCQPRLAPANSERCRPFQSAASRPDRLVVPAAGRQPHDSMMGICRPAASTTKCDAIRESLWWVPTLVGTVPATSRSDRWCQPRLAPANSERCRRFRSGASRPDRLVVAGAGRAPPPPPGGEGRPPAGPPPSGDPAHPPRTVWSCRPLAGNITIPWGASAGQRPALPNATPCATQASALRYWPANSTAGAPGRGGRNRFPAPGSASWCGSCGSACWAWTRPAHRCRAPCSGAARAPCAADR